ncbi:tRNA (adenosine(37)-N6)-threonylcarbamoyltransferase complex ATPase subunit type 1 TsaE [Patescibacteria group bacterium]|nr:tRNA (adenosine(37)-N6)-threonylcarbamoyltransferase complex ATPase subunit type 1 TsaE [Patescibacteria group bacterium]
MISKNLEETQQIALDFVRNLQPKENEATVIGLYGDLGAGKTSFTQGLSKALGILETVVSPTFVIEKIYELTNQQFTHLIHIDAYRLEKSEELLHLGWKEIISDPKNLIAVEWPERVVDIMPEHIKIMLKALENADFREIEVVS